MALENDVVLIYMEEAPMAFARVEHIVADHKPDWFQVTLLILAIPMKTVTWILREEYINGGTFTMEGKAMRLELVEPSGEAVRLKNVEKDPMATAKTERVKPSGKKADVIAFPSWKEDPRH